jgi:hypothetical protein
MRFPFPGRHGGSPLLQRLLTQRLPDAPAPNCLKCSKAMPNDAVKRVSIEPVTHGTFKVACLVRCACGARHIGHRAIAADMRTTRFLSQEFELYSEDVHGPALKAVQGRIEAKRDKLAEIEARPVTEHLGAAAKAG